MRADAALERLGGVATATSLLRHTSPKKLQAALRRGEVVRDGRGRYSLPGLERAVVAANRLSGVLAEDSAAQYYGWKLKHVPVTPCVVVPRKRRPPERREEVRVRFRDLDADDVNGLATRPLRTGLDCAARLPNDFGARRRGLRTPVGGGRQA